MSSDLREDLRAYFGALAEAGTAEGVTEQPAERNVGRTLALVSVVVVAILAGAIAVTGGLSSDGEKRLEATGPPATEPTSSTEGPPVSVEGSVAPLEVEWTQIADLGWTGGASSATAVVVDGELVIIGTNGTNEAAGPRGVRVGLDGTDAAPIAAGPLNRRSSSALVWTGTELLVLGGSNGTEVEPYGAAYDPTRDSWRVIPAPPDGTIPSVTWAGDALISWLTSAELEVGGVGWGHIPPAPLTPRTEAVEVAADHELFVWGGCETAGCSDFGTPTGSLDGATYDPASGQWTTVPQSPFVSGNGAVAASRGATIYVVANDSEAGGDSPFASFSLTSRSWTPLPSSPLAQRREARAVVLDSGSFVYGGGNDPRGFRSSDIARFDPQSSSWSVGTLPEGGGSLCGLTESGDQVIAVMCGDATTVHVATIS